MTADLATSLSIALPELILAVGAMVVLMIGVYAGRSATGLVSVLSVLLLAAAAIWLVTTDASGEAFGGAIILVVFFGLYPAPVFNATAASLDNLLHNVTATIETTHQVASAQK
jgi:NADH:ubiquinone oxidoreductase subunit 2 (subunit N)